MNTRALDTSDILDTLENGTLLIRTNDTLDMNKTRMKVNSFQDREHVIPNQFKAKYLTQNFAM